ncbi:MAG: CCA tRNA nucleotidyltransferase [Hyphomicrobiales bacterium]
MGADPQKLPSLAGRDWLEDARFQAVVKALEAAGGEARAVGGCVRDALLGEPAGDIDIATTLSPEAVMEAGKKAGLGAHPTGIDHGSVTLVSGPEGAHVPYEVTTLRVDEETYGRHAKVAFTSDWEADARRRDFTMNALYCGADGTVFDPVGGYGDIVTRTVRFVGNPAHRIKEDYLRILRFFRFHARFGKGQPEENARAACRQARSELDGLSRERIRQEFFKLLAAKGGPATIHLMNDDGVLEHVLNGKISVQALEKLGEIDAARKGCSDALLRLAVLYGQVGASEAREAFVLTNSETVRLRNLRSAPQVTPNFRVEERERLLYWFGAQTFSDSILASWACSDAPANNADWFGLLNLAGSWVQPEFPLSGEDLLENGIEEGPRLGEILQTIEDWWVAGGFTASRDDLLKRLRNMS